MEIQINSYDDLITFIEREEISYEQGFKVVCKALGVLGVSFDNDKKQLIEDTKEHIKRWGNYSGEQPILTLNQKGIDFNIRDVYRNRD